MKSVSLRSTSLNEISKRTLFDFSIRESTKSNQTKKNTEIREQTNTEIRDIQVVNHV